MFCLRNFQIFLLSLSLVRDPPEATLVDSQAQDFRFERLAWNSKFDGRAGWTGDAANSLRQARKSNPLFYVLSPGNLFCRRPDNSSSYYTRIKISSSTGLLARIFLSLGDCLTELSIHQGTRRQCHNSAISIVRANGLWQPRRGNSRPADLPAHELTTRRTE
jgi:hypothetical protein